MIFSLSRISCALFAAGVVLTNPVQAAEARLDPLATGSAPGSNMSGGLAGQWYQIDGSLRFSDFVYEGQAIKEYGWGTGIWAVGDIAAIMSGSIPAVATAQTVGAVNYANNIYNNTLQSGAYGTWAEDRVRPLTPFQVANSCTAQSDGCASETNYAATFSGYLYVEEAGSYDFGVFADDGFSFGLLGAGNQSLGMEYASVAGSTGRESFTLQSFNSLSAIHLDQGYYGLSLAYFNRLEAGVIELAWTRTDTASAWTTIGSGNLSPTTPVPEPQTYAMLLAGALVVASITRRSLRHRIVV